MHRNIIMWNLCNRKENRYLNIRLFLICLHTFLLNFVILFIKYGAILEAFIHTYIYLLPFQIFSAFLIGYWSPERNWYYQARRVIYTLNFLVGYPHSKQHALWRCAYGLILHDVNSNLQALFNCQMINIYQNRVIIHILYAIENKYDLVKAWY
jgi:hypothetical protein